jgi:hypothetical protein
MKSTNIEPQEAGLYRTVKYPEVHLIESEEHDDSRSQPQAQDDFA